MQSFLRLFILSICALTMAVPHPSEAARRKTTPSRPAATGVNDPRYASLIMDPKTGEIYHSRNADARRYPASLTKMMTLYLLFEALENGKTTLRTQMKVSNHAASQPQTNISLRPGETVPVELAIKALVVRSANDVAVVVAEHLGGTEANFAQRMTNKAQALGMRNTVFKNPHGLPNSGQVTTAKDMAKLGIALKRDFPQYYDYFQTREFSWKGVTYYTHNRVMLRYSGTDGIKTGYINASGFNIVSSVTRGGRPLIGVVMGGGSGAWRDDRMIALLSQGYQTLAGRGQARGTIVASNLPLSKSGQPTTAQQAQASDTAVRSSVQMASVQPDRGIVRTEQAQKAAEEVRTLPAGDGNPQTLDAQLAARMAGMGSGWGIQVGAYSTKALAEKAAQQAYQLAGPSVQGSRIAVSGAGAGRTTIHRARLENMSEGQARKACERLISNNSPCFIYRAGSQNL